MKKSKTESFFWTSYSDMMTTLFFIMLVLFVLAIVLLHNKISEQRLRLEEFEKIEEIKKSLNDIDSTYFVYNPVYKKHVLNITVNFPPRVSDIYSIDGETLKKLEKAGWAIKHRIDETSKANSDIQYLLIIEGQASKDKYRYNYQLSYERALALRDYWERCGIRFGDNCEVLISGSGVGGAMRDDTERNNRRFLIQIIPKVGAIEQSSN